MRKALAMLLIPLILVGCSEDDPPEPYEWRQRYTYAYNPPPAHCASMSTTLEIIDRFGQPETEFIQGELINVRMGVRNDSSAPVVLTHPNGCPPVGFEVVNAANEVIATDDTGLMCTQAPIPVEYGPGETVLYTWAWDQVMLNDAAAPIGDYTLYADERTECRFALSKTSPLGIR